MLKDLADSKRINQRIQTTASVSHSRLLVLPDGKDSTSPPPLPHPSRAFNCQSVIQPKIISRHFWPTFPASALVLPGQLQAFVS